MKCGGKGSGTYSQVMPLTRKIVASNLLRWWHGDLSQPERLNEFSTIYSTFSKPVQLRIDAFSVYFFDLLQ